MRRSRVMSEKQVQWVAAQVARGCTYATIEERVALSPGTLGQIVHHCRAGRMLWALPIVDAVDARQGAGSSAVECDDAMNPTLAKQQREAQRIEELKRRHLRQPEGKPGRKPSASAWTPDEIERCAAVMRTGATKREAVVVIGRSVTSLVRALESGLGKFDELRKAADDGAAKKSAAKRERVRRILSDVQAGANVNKAARANGMSPTTFYSRVKDDCRAQKIIRDTANHRLSMPGPKNGPDISGEHGKVYVIGAVSRSGALEAFKVGFTRQRVSYRRKKLQVGSPFRLVVLRECDGTGDDERALLDRLARYRIRGEWFDADPEALQIAEIAWTPN